MEINNYLDYYSYKEQEDLVYYLISLFYKTNRKYICARPKINRLLTIYILCNIKNKYNLQDSRFYVEESCMGFDLGYIDRDIYLCFNRDSNEKIVDKFNEEVEIPHNYKKYIDKININQNTKTLLELIFREFGNYSINELAPKIDALKKIMILDVKYNNTVNINVEKFLKALNDKEIIKNFKENEIFNFIRAYHNEKHTKTNKVNDETVVKYNKLVRDNIPKIIENQGDIPIIRNIYDRRDYKKELMNELQNIYNELDNLNKEEYIEKLSDMIEIIRQLAKLEYTPFDYLTALIDEKTNKFGAYEDRVYLERVLKK